MESSPALSRLLKPTTASQPPTQPPTSIQPPDYPTASFNSLPPELKAHILLHIAQQERLDALKADEDALDQAEDDPFVHEMITDDDDSEVEEVDGDADDAEEGVMAETGWTDPPSVDSLWNVARVSRELAGLAWPHLWKRVDFTDRSTEDVLTFYHDILPRHSHHIHAIRFDQLHHLDEMMPGHRIAELLPTLVSPHEELPQERKSELATVAERQPWRLRSYVFAAIVNALPRLDALVFDLAPFIGRSEDANNDAVDERTVNPLLQAVEAAGDRVVNVTIATPIVALNGSQLGAFLRALPKLLRLEMEFTLRPNGGGEEELVAALASLAHLESLSISSAPWVNATFARAPWAAPLRVLALNSCDQLWVEDLRMLVEKFSPTLDTLDLDDSPAGELYDDGEPRRSLEARQAAQGKDWLRAWALPKLNYLVLSNDQNNHFLNFFADSPIHTFEFGYCPLLPVKEVEAFLKLRAERAGPGKLREVRIKGDADLTDGQREGIEVWCYSKGVVCKNEVGGGWTSEYSDDEMGDRDGFEEWSDEDEDEQGYDEDMDRGVDEDGEGWESDDDGDGDGDE